MTLNLWQADIKASQHTINRMSWKTGTSALSIMTLTILVFFLCLTGTLEVSHLVMPMKAVKKDCLVHTSIQWLRGHQGNQAESQNGWVQRGDKQQPVKVSGLQAYCVVVETHSERNLMALSLKSQPWGRPGTIACLWMQWLALLHRSIHLSALVLWAFLGFCSACNLGMLLPASSSDLS